MRLRNVSEGKGDRKEILGRIFANTRSSVSPSMAIGAGWNWRVR